MRGRCGRWLVVVLLALACAGCRLDATLLVDLAADGSGAVEVVLTADRALLAQAEAGGADPLATLARAVRDVPGWQVRGDAVEGGGRRLRLRGRFADPDEFHVIAGALDRALSAPELDPLGPMELDLEAGRVRLHGVAALRPAAAVAELGMTEAQAAATLDTAVRYEVRVRLPGEVLDTNADEQDGQELVWRVPAGGEARITAEGTRPVRRTWPLLLGGAVAAGLTAWALRRRPQPAPVLREDEPA